MLQSLEVSLALDRMACMLRGEVQRDKSPALLDTTALMRAAGARFVISGGLAVQRYVARPRFTADIDVVIEPEHESKLLEALGQSPFNEIFEFVHRKRTWTALIHRPTGTEVDVNASGLFRATLADPQELELQGSRIPFANLLEVAYTKLRTQQRKWPRDPRKRLQDRADLMGLLRDNPDLYSRLRARAEERLRPLLDEVQRESLGADEAPPETDPGQ